MPAALPHGSHACFRYGFAVYMDVSVTDVAIQGLNGLKMGDRTLTVRRAAEVSGGRGAGLMADFITSIHV